MHKYLPGRAQSTSFSIASHGPLGRRSAAIDICRCLFQRFIHTAMQYHLPFLLASCMEPNDPSIEGGLRGSHSTLHRLWRIPPQSLCSVMWVMGMIISPSTAHCHRCQWASLPTGVSWNSATNGGFHGRRICPVGGIHVTQSRGVPG